MRREQQIQNPKREKKQSVEFFAILGEVATNSGELKGKKINSFARTTCAKLDLAIEHHFYQLDAITEGKLTLKVVASHQFNRTQFGLFLLNARECSLQLFVETESRAIIPDAICDRVESHLKTACESLTNYSGPKGTSCLGKNHARPL